MIIVCNWWLLISFAIPHPTRNIIYMAELFHETGSVAAQTITNMNMWLIVRSLNVATTSCILFKMSILPLISSTTIVILSSTSFAAADFTERGKPCSQCGSTLRDRFRRRECWLVYTSSCHIRVLMEQLESIALQAHTCKYCKETYLSCSLFFHV